MNHRTKLSTRRLMIAFTVALAAALAAATLVLVGTQDSSTPSVMPSTHTTNDTETSMENRRTPTPSTSSTFATPTPSSTPTLDLSWRDTDFAVDPARTQWPTEPAEHKTIYLTFDDGPSQNTERVLNILDSHGIKATFFVTGLLPEYASWIKEAYSRGHTIGLHTYTHDYAQLYSSVDAFYNDLDAIGELVRNQIGYIPAFIRFAGGSSNTISANYTSGIMTTLAADVQSRGYQYYDWTGSCGDGAVHPADVLITEATKYADQDTIVLLMHDSASKDSTVEALPAIIEFYTNAGYEFRALDRKTPAPHHGIGN